MFRKYLIKLQAWLAFGSKVKEADALFRKDGQRRFLVPFNNGDMEVLTKEEALALKKVGLMARDLSAKLLYNACYYYTNTTDVHAAVKCAMPKREINRRKKAFYKWFERHHSKDCI